MQSNQRRRQRHPEDRPAISAKQFVLAVVSFGAIVGYIMGRLHALGRTA